jgi:type I restriction enzyme S subunit
MPRRWKPSRLKYWTRINPEVLTEDYNPGGEIEYVDIGSVDQIRGITSTERMYFADAPSRARRAVRDGDTIVSTVRTYLRAVAPIKSPPPNLIVSTGFAVLRPGPEAYPPFLAWLCQSQELVERIVANSNGVSYPAINPSVLGSLPVRFPPLDEQQEIAKFLDRETARIDELIAKKEQLSDLLTQKRDAYVDNLVKLGLDGSAAKLRTTGEYHWKSIPRNWELKPLMYLTPASRRIMYGIVLPGPDVPNGVPIVKGGNCEEGRLRLEFMSRTTHEIESNCERSRLREGDIVYSIRGTVGSAQLVPRELEGCNITQDAARISPKPGLNGRWLLYTLRSRTFFGQLEAGTLGAAVRGINIRDLKRGQVPVPPYAEQVGIVRQIEEFAHLHEKLAGSIRVGIDKLREYRTSLISAAVTGQIDVRTYRKEPEAVLETTA